MADVRQRVGARIRQLRLRQDTTQEQLAERAGLSYKFLGEMERGAGNPSLKSLERVAAALGVEVESFFSAQRDDYAVRDGQNANMLLRETVDALKGVVTRLERSPSSSPRRASRRPKRR